MILLAKDLVDLERDDRRVLGAFRLVDASTGAPVVTAATIEVRRAQIVEAGPPEVITPVALGTGAVRIQQNRSGWFVVSRAPLFGTYITAFSDPVTPPELQPARELRLRFQIVDAGPQYLPRFFDFALPRALDPAAADSVLAPLDVALLRAPTMTAADGWGVLRVSVRREGTGAALGGVLVRAFRRPRVAGAEPIGVGLTEWRSESVRGEAAVPLPGLQRFVPGAGPNVFETTHAIELEATRDQNFPASSADLPDVDRLIAGSGAGIVRRAATPANPPLAVIRPAQPLVLAAGQELVVELELP